MKTVVVDMIADCTQVGGSPAAVASRDQVRYVAAANKRFVKIVEPHFVNAARQAGVDLDEGRPGSPEWNRAVAEWNADPNAHDQARQAVLTAVWAAVDLEALAKQAIAEAAVTAARADLSARPPRETSSARPAAVTRTAPPPQQNDKGEMWAVVVLGVVVLGVLGLFVGGGASPKTSTPSAPASATEQDCFTAQAAAAIAASDDTMSDAAVARLNDKMDEVCEAYNASPRGRWGE